MIRVACPHCRRTFRTMTEGMGQTAVCSGCHESFRIGSARPPFTWKPNSLAEDSWVGVEPPQEKKEIKHCIMCDAPLEEDAIRCMACGANQITGLVHKSRNRPVQEVKAPFWSWLPIKPLIVLALVVGIGGGVFVAVKKMFSAAVDEGLEMAQVRFVNGAARELAGGMDLDEFAAKYAGRIDDRTLPRMLQLLEAGDPMIRKAAAPLIACGRITKIGPIVAQARSEKAVVANGALGILQAIGPHRLVDLSNHADADVSRAAAEALCLLFKLEPKEEILESLSGTGSAAEKIEQLNKLCRPWPRAVGRFAVAIDGKPAPMTATIEQIGRAFYLEIGSGRFVSDSQADRRFTIPVAKWCAATGVAVDLQEVRNWIDGTVMVASPYGAGWEGEARITARKKLTSPPPGFLPVESLDRNQSVVLPVTFEQQ